MSAPIRVLRDVARGASCRQSSADPRGPAEWAQANRAVRGVKTGECSFRTDVEERPWWQAELRAPVRVVAVVVYNCDGPALDPSMTAGELREPVRHLQLALRDAKGAWRLPYDRATAGGEDFGGIHTGPLIVRLDEAEVSAIRIEIAARRALNLDAVEVFAEEAIPRDQAVRELLAAANDHNFAIASENLGRLALTTEELAAAALPGEIGLNDVGLGFVTQVLALRDDLAAAERLATRYAAEGVHSASFGETLVRREIERGRPAEARAVLERLAHAHPDLERLVPLGTAIREMDEQRGRRAVKLIIWDLDDTLWEGTLAEGDDLKLNVARAAMVRTATDRGIICTIASKNDRTEALARLRAWGLEEHFILPWFGFQPKGAAIASLIGRLQLRSPDCLFVDDNPLNLEEARAASPGLQTLDARDPGTDEALRALLARAKPDGGKRFREYLIVQDKEQAHDEHGGDNDDFLRTCAIRVAIVEDARNIHFADRIEELVNRTNQLNFTKSRIPPGTAGYLVGAVLEYDCRTVFVRDRFGSYGLVGFLAFKRATREIEHFVLSCRVMNMHVENAVMQQLVDTLPDVRPIVAPFRRTYIEVVDHRDADFQDDFRAAGKGVADIRVMANCQSGILIHYLELGGRCDPDSWPDVFSLERGDPLEAARTAPYRHHLLLLSAQYAAQAWTRFSVGAFEAALDASVARWTAEAGLTCVLLAPDAETSAIEDVDGRRWSHGELNGVARAVLARRPSVRQLELGQWVRLPSDVGADARHYSRELLRRVAGELRRAIDAHDRALDGVPA